MSSSRKQFKTKRVMVLLSLAVITGMVWLFMYTNQKIIVCQHNQDIKLLQEKMSIYLIENYEGIKKIEWKGWEPGIKTSNPKTYMSINDYDKQYDSNAILGYSFDREELDYRDKEETEKDRFEEYIEYTDNRLQDMREFEGRVVYPEMGIKKSEKGSPNAKIIYNYEEKY